MSKISLLRKLELGKLKNLRLDGEILDLGGGRDAYYAKLIGGRHQITVLNLSAESRPDLLWDLERGLPQDLGSFDAVLALNVLEHIYNYKFLVSEIFRVLKRGGTFAGVTPFLLNVHPDPEDYFRYTRSALDKILKEAGFYRIEVEELGYGPMSARFYLLHNFLPGFLNGLLEPLAIFADRALGSFAKFFGKEYRPERYPLGYFFRAEKQ